MDPKIAFYYSQKGLSPRVRFRVKGPDLVDRISLNNVSNKPEDVWKVVDEAKD
jgi:hypothetical protein